MLFASQQQGAAASDSMIASYASQTDLGDFVSNKEEMYRLQPEYDYSRPAHEGLLNYEAWEWAMCGSQVCEAFKMCLDGIVDRDHLRALVPTQLNSPGNW